MSKRTKKSEQTVAFAQVPVWLLRSGKDVSHGALRLWAVIKSYTKNGENTAFPSQKRLAKDMGVSERQVYTYTQQLKERGALDFRLKTNSDGTKSRNYEYTLAWESPFRYPKDTSTINDDTPEENFHQSDGTVEENFDPTVEENFDSTPEGNFRVTTPTEHTPIEPENRLGKVPLSSVERLFFRDEEIEDDAPTASRRLHSADEKRKGDEDTFRMLRQALGRAS